MTTHGRRVSVIGLGYVGLRLAASFGRRGPVVGFDVDSRRVAELAGGFDRTGEVDAEEFSAAMVAYTTDPEDLDGADFHVVAVPTPIDDAKQPVLDHLLAASRTVGSHLGRGDIVVYESTVYPGATEEECVPALEDASGLRCGSDFFVGYSPERINPGDRTHTFAKIAKVVSAQDPETLEVVAAVYGSVVDGTVHRAPSIQVAEAAKVVENTQRDLNIALMNEFALIFDRMGIDTGDVLAAAATKWNFLPFTPGLVGGHCVGVDPYYLTHKAMRLGYEPQMILAGRRINDGRGTLVARRVIDMLIREGRRVGGSVVTVLGLAFKEDVRDPRSSLVVDIVRRLQESGVVVQVHDPLVERAEALAHHGIRALDRQELAPGDGVVVAVAHREFADAGWEGVTTLLRGGRGIVVDVKRMLDRAAAPDGVALWRL